jgi:hypothetical protein
MVYADSFQHLALIGKEGGKPFNQYAIQQFSGKCDIYNFPIYDGDIVELVLALQTDDHGRKRGPADSFGIYEVFYHERSAAYFLRVHRSNWLDTWFTTEKQAAKLTIDPRCPHVTCLERELGNFGITHVIGNIFENPELLDNDNASISI